MTPAPNTTRDKILEAAIDLFWLHGYSAVSIDDICKKAIINKGSFYHFFPSKSELIIATFDAMAAYMKPLLDDVFSPARIPEDRLKRYSEMAYEQQKSLAVKHGKVMGCPFMTCGSELSTQDERLRRKIEEKFDRSTAYFSDLLKDAGVRQQRIILAQEMFSYVTGIMYQARVKNDVEIIKRDLLPGLMRYLKPAPTKEKNLKESYA